MIKMCCEDCEQLTNEDEIALPASFEMGLEDGVEYYFQVVCNNCWDIRIQKFTAAACETLRKPLLGDCINDIFEELEIK